MDDYTDLLEDSVESLATSGYCDIAASVLLESFPKAQLYRLTDADRQRCAHVFLLVGGRALDINGFRSLEEMAATGADEALHAEPVSLDDVQNSFRGHGRKAEERRIVQKRFRDHVEQNPRTFSRGAE